VKGREWYQEDETAEEYDEWRFSRGGELVDEGEKAALFDLVDDIGGDRILEVACGTGRFAVELAESGAEVTGVDISKPMLMKGVGKARERGLGVEFMRGDAKQLPFPDDSFDLVLGMRFFHLIDEPAAYLREMARVSEGRVVFDTFNRGSARVVYNRFLPMGSRLYSEEDVRGVVEEAGVELIERRDDFVVPFGLYRAIPKTLAKGFRSIDDAAQSVGGEKLSSVTYWMVEK
jgi:ubiquinone/menaquinone biosynthesis C-methylase UbiE